MRQARFTGNSCMVVVVKMRFYLGLQPQVNKRTDEMNGHCPVNAEWAFFKPPHLHGLTCIGRTAMDFLLLIIFAGSS